MITSFERNNLNFFQKRKRNKQQDLRISVFITLIDT